MQHPNGMSWDFSAQPGFVSSVTHLDDSAANEEGHVRSPDLVFQGDCVPAVALAKGAANASANWAAWKGGKGHQYGYGYGKGLGYG